MQCFTILYPLLVNIQMSTYVKIENCFVSLAKYLGSELATSVADENVTFCTTLSTRFHNMNMNIHYKITPKVILITIQS
jgi:hypothetical protein